MSSSHPVVLRGCLLAALLLSAACVRSVPRETADVDVLVIAPHPDDEVLLAAGVIERAVRSGQRVAVILVTNGDFTCERDGYQREAESVVALKSLGVRASDIHFLGYPDGALSKLGRDPLAAMEHRDANGECVGLSGTYADRRAGRLDEHTQRTGTPGDWTSAGLTLDLAAVLGRLKPREVYLPHAIDDHPDHAMTYVFFRRAIEAAGWAPSLVHRGVVHAGACWPSACGSYFTPEAPIAPLPPPWTGYLPDERIPVDAQRKLLFIARYTSQAGNEPQQDWLSSFARREEVFFTERYVREGARWVQAGSTPRSATERVLAVGTYEEWNQWGADGFAAAGVRPR